MEGKLWVANQSLFKLTIGDVTENVFDLVRVTPAADNTRLHGINCDYTFYCGLKFHQDFDIQQLIGQSAQLSFFNADYQAQTFAGYISKAAGDIYAEDAVVVQLSSPWYPLRLNKASHEYLSTAVAEVIDNVLKRNNWNQDQYKLALSQTYPVLPLVTQNQQSDFDFLQQQLSYWGLSTVFIADKNSDTTQLYITDNLDQLPKPVAADLTFQIETGQSQQVAHVFHAQQSQQILPETVTLTSFNPNLPTDQIEASVTAQSNIRGLGCCVQEDLCINQQAMAEQIAYTRSQAYDCRREVFEFHTTEPLLQAGQQLAVNNHPLQDLNGEFRIINIAHYANETPHKHNKRRYYNVVSAIPADLPYRPLPNNQQADLIL